MEVTYLHNYSVYSMQCQIICVKINELCKFSVDDPDKSTDFLYIDDPLPSDGDCPIFIPLFFGWSCHLLPYYETYYCMVGE